MIEPTCELFYKWNQNDHVVKYVRLDNAGENVKLQARSQSKDWKLNITYEFTAKDKPQQNHLAELGFYMLANKARALMAVAHIPYSV